MFTVVCVLQGPLYVHCGVCVAETIVHCGVCVCVACRDVQLNAGRRIAQILHTVPFTEEEVIKKWKTLPPADGQMLIVL